MDLQNKLLTLWQSRNFGDIYSASKRISERDLRALHDSVASFVGVVCAANSDHKEALRFFRYSFSKNNSNPDHRLNLGNCLKDLERHEQARKIYNGSTHIREDPHLMLGAAVCDIQLGLLVEAEKLLELALSKDKSNSKIYYNLGVVKLRLEKLSDAETFLRRSLAMDPGHHESANLLSIVGFKNQNISLGTELAEQIMRADQYPDSFLLELMSVTMEVARPHLGLHFYEARKRELSEDVDFMAAELSRYMGDHSGAVRLCKRVLAKDPSFFSSRITLCQSSKSLGDLTSAFEYEDSVLAEVPAEKKLNRLPNPWALFAVLPDAKHQLRFSKSYANGHYNNLPREKVWASAAEVDLPLGFISPDFGAHPVGECMLPIFDSSPGGYKTICLSNRIQEDEVSARIRESVDEFHSIKGLGYEDVKRICRDLRINHLVDLAVYTSGGVPRHLALGLAPVQVNYLGYSGSSGARAYDYIVADRYIIPEKMARNYSERVVLLDHPLMGCSLRDLSTIEGVPKASYGLPEDAFVFGCLASRYKFSRKVLESWALILNSCPGSVLLLANASDEDQAKLRGYLSTLGLEGSRVFFAKREPTRNDHLARLSMVDVFLDTFPYNAHSLAADAVSRAVPLVTVSGTAFASRVAGSIVTHAGCGELAVDTFDEYVSAACKLFESETYRRDVRSKVREALHSLGDTTSYANDLYEKIGSLDVRD